MKGKVIVIIIIYFLIFPLCTFAQETAKSTTVIELNSGRILYEKNANDKLLIASTTKIMTAILAIENGRLNDTVEVGNEILKIYGTNLYLEVGEKIKIRDLLYGLILRSGNDASVVLAKYIGGTQENFVKMMNSKAKELGMKNTSFSNPHGLDDDTENYSTSNDMAILSMYAYQNKTYRKIASTKKYKTSTKNKSYLWYNRNKLLTTYEYCTGGKNGYTPRAGKTLVTTAKKNNLELSIITLNDNNEYNTHEELYELMFEKYRNYKIIDKNKFIAPQEKRDNSKYYIKNSFVYPITSSEKKQIKTKIKIYNTKDIVSKKKGEIIVLLKDTEIGKVNIYEKAKEKEVTTLPLKIKNYLFDILKKLKLGLQNNLKPGPLVPIPLEIYKLDSSI